MNEALWRLLSDGSNRDVTVHLRSNRTGEPVEPECPAYKPVTLRNQVMWPGVKWQDAVFIFTGWVGWLYGWWVECDGETIAEGDFDKPFFAATRGSRVIIPLYIPKQQFQPAPIEV